MKHPYPLQAEEKNNSSSGKLALFLALIALFILMLQFRAYGSGLSNIIDEVTLTFLQETPLVKIVNDTHTSSSSVEKGQRIDLEVFVKKPGYLSALLLNKSGDITQIQGIYKQAVGPHDLWSSLGVAPPEVHEYQLLVVILHDQKPSDVVSVEYHYAHQDDAAYGDKIRQIVNKLTRDQFSSSLHSIDVEEAVSEHPIKSWFTIKAESLSNTARRYLFANR